MLFNCGVDFVIIKVAVTGFAVCHAPVDFLVGKIRIYINRAGLSK